MYLHAVYIYIYVYVYVYDTYVHAGFMIGDAWNLSVFFSTAPFHSSIKEL